MHYLCNFLFSTLIELHCLLLIIVCIQDLYKKIFNLNVSVLYLKLLHFLIFIVSKTGGIVKCLETLYATVTKEQLKNEILAELCKSHAGYLIFEGAVEYCVNTVLLMILILNLPKIDKSVLKPILFLNTKIIDAIHIADNSRNSSSNR